MNNKDDKHLWDRFCRLGEMIGDGLHYEDPQISKEYNQLLKILLPPTEEEKEWKRKIREERNKNMNKQITEKLKVDKCKCGGELKQTRSGSKTVKCVDCEQRYKYKTKKL